MITVARSTFFPISTTHEDVWYARYERGEKLWNLKWLQNQRENMEKNETERKGNGTDVYKYDFWFSKAEMKPRVLF